MSAPREWTLRGMQVFGPSGDHAYSLPTIEPNVPRDAVIRVLEAAPIEAEREKLLDLIEDCLRAVKNNRQWGTLHKMEAVLKANGRLGGSE